MTLTATPFTPFSITHGQNMDMFPTRSELSVAQAANMLGIPESDMIELLDTGKIESHTIGNQRAVIAASLRDYDRETARLQDEALDELTQQAQGWGDY